MYPWPFYNFSISERTIAHKEGQGRDKGMDECEKRRRERGGRLVIISKGHSVNDYPLG